MTQKVKVINLGLPKSGTTTLGVALEKAGLRVADWKVRRGNPHATAYGFVGQLMYHGYFKKGDPLAHLQNFDAFPELNIVRNGFNLWPQTDWGLLTTIRTLYPETKFTLTWRDPRKLSDSMMRWSNLGRKRLPDNAIPGLPAGYGTTEEEQVRWIEGHYKFCRQVFDKSSDFLEYDIEDAAAPEKISAFLGIELPWWGVANENANNPGSGQTNPNDTSPA